MQNIIIVYKPKINAKHNHRLLTKKSMQNTIIDFKPKNQWKIQSSFINQKINAKRNHRLQIKNQCKT